MTDRILIPHGDRWLAMTPEQFQNALEQGSRLMPPKPENTAQGLPQLLTADQMAERSGVPASWWLEAAKRGAIPSVTLGKYRRFSASILSATDRASVSDSGAKQATARLSAVLK